MLSWNVAAGRLMLARLDTLQTERTAVLKRIAEAELREFKNSSGASPVRSAAVGTGFSLVTAGERLVTAGERTVSVGRSALSLPLAIERYCHLGNAKPLDVVTETLDVVTEHQICDEALESHSATSAVAKISRIGFPIRDG
jgi:hypothetical protein